jgi:hypothetical protein
VAKRLRHRHVQGLSINAGKQLALAVSRQHIVLARYYIIALRKKKWYSTYHQGIVLSTLSLSLSAIMLDYLIGTRPI